MCLVEEVLDVLVAEGLVAADNLMEIRVHQLVPAPRGGGASVAKGEQQTLVTHQWGGGGKLKREKGWGARAGRAH